jgi:hypothetical protein
VVSAISKAETLSMTASLLAEDDEELVQLSSDPVNGRGRLLAVKQKPESTSSKPVVAHRSPAGRQARACALWPGGGPGVFEYHPRGDG